LQLPFFLIFSYKNGNQYQIAVSDCRLRPLRKRFHRLVGHSTGYRILDFLQGGSRQCAPAVSTHRMPSSTRRLSAKKSKTETFGAIFLGVNGFENSRRQQKFQQKAGECNE